LKIELSDKKIIEVPAQWVTKFGDPIVIEGLTDGFWTKKVKSDETDD